MEVSLCTKINETSIVATEAKSLADANAITINEFRTKLDNLKKNMHFVKKGK